MKANSIIFKIFVASVLAAVYIGLVVCEATFTIIAAFVAVAFGSISSRVKRCAFGRACFIITRASSNMIDYLTFNMVNQYKVCVGRYNAITK